MMWLRRKFTTMMSCIFPSMNFDKNSRMATEKTLLADSALIWNRSKYDADLAVDILRFGVAGFKEVAGTMALRTTWVLHILSPYSKIRASRPQVVILNFSYV